ncbi:cystatin-like [Engystomops pustulosus]|uniref:cystatin-like n=1 Tax=Engystomops pustulosus TaxID=76066 RepID=UPI003AFB32C7
MARLCVVLAVLVCLSAITQASQLLGGWEPLDVDSAGVKQAMESALSQYNKQSNDMFQYRAVKVNKAKKQVVSGIKYILDVDVGRTNCRKPATNANACQLHTDPTLAKISTCTFEVFVKPWMGISKLINHSCASST